MGVDSVHNGLDSNTETDCRKDKIIKLTNKIELEVVHNNIMEETRKAFKK